MGDQAIEKEIQDKGLTAPRVEVTINGRAHALDDIAHHETISYERLCLEAGKDNALNPTCVYSLPDTRGGSITAGQRAPLVQGAVYNVMLTGNA